jgi:dissimilatory sulfite reductase (desulfoviridin) alpha/beta subunit
MILQAEQKRQSDMRDMEAKLAKITNLLQQGGGGEQKRAPALCIVCQDAARDCMCALASLSDSLLSSPTPFHAVLCSFGCGHYCTCLKW